MNPLLAAAVLPALALIFYVYKQDRIEKEPWGLLFKLMFWGAVTVIPAALIEAAGDAIIGIFYEEDSTQFLLISCFAVIGLAEEGLKYFVFHKKVWNSPEFNYRFDAIVFAVCISLGFAMLENILYVFEGGFNTAVIRAFTAIPAHAINAVFMGYYFGQAKLSQSMGEHRAEIIDKRLALLVPLVLHGFYDFCAMKQTEFFTVVFLIFVVVMDILAVSRIRRSSEHDMRV
ncbi:MAG: PrsW family intramembrane metalloprotease [Lachnospiraceae bacterium]|nr:PrsW family intramembrane metalloprotease [Lachnospiraceae bacterium]